nr:immunoglobulin light chain junction region [Macaca mulatta]MOW15270.1 immunoglobulin light chain junction region [Macaca mulatta]MOW16330.1 immunoglobulin light chain junction region [Macaca mulatta]MOW17112.1 immunoglobulin light chain junction region [Macaca mulatta]MOW17496.1 immunoglobulin light chain junction region [Macaca mulatta]
DYYCALYMGSAISFF